MIHALFPTIGDVVAAAFWLALGFLFRAVWRDHRADRAPRMNLDFELDDPPPGFRILPRPFDWHRDL